MAEIRIGIDCRFPSISILDDKSQHCIVYWHTRLVAENLEVVSLIDPCSDSFGLASAPVRAVLFIVGLILVRISL
jgi:hypothetical protein